MLKKKKFGSQRPQMSGEMELQITSMADIFTILLVFLLKSYAAGVNVNPTKGMMLPTAQAAETQIEALKLEVSENAISVEGQPIATLKGYRFDAGDLETNLSSKSLTTSLDKERKRQLLIAQGNSAVKVDPKIIIIADQRVPYVTIKSVLASAALQGFTDFKLAVVKSE